MIKPKLSTLCFQSVENVDVLCKFLKNHNHKKLSDDKHLTMWMAYYLVAEVVIVLRHHPCIS